MDRINLNSQSERPCHGDGPYAGGVLRPPTRRIDGTSNSTVQVRENGGTYRRRKTFFQETCNDLGGSVTSPIDYLLRNIAQNGVRCDMFLYYWWCAPHPLRF